MSEGTEKQKDLETLPDFDGKYIRLALISERQMTCAFSAEDATGQAVFIKMLRESKVGDEIAERLFANEAALLQLINRHAPWVPILPLIETGIIQGRAYFVQPLLNGYTLRAALRAHPTLAGQSAINLIERCLEFLGALHAAGIVHGDLSPDNLFLETHEALARGGQLPDQYQLRLVDYNSARRSEGPENQPGQTVFLKLPYAAPELASGYPLSPRSDLYSLGVVFFEALTGERPYDVKTMADVAARRDSSFPAIPLAFDIPSAIERFIRTLAAADPDARPRFAGDALRELRDLKDVHRWISQVEAPLLPAFHRRAEGRRADGPSAPYEDFLGGAQPITLVSRPRHSTPPPGPWPEAGVDEDVPIITEAAALVASPSYASPGDRAETSMAYAVPVPSVERGVSKVDFSVFAPASIAPGTSFILEVWAYLREQRDQLLELAGRHGRLIERGSRGPVVAELGTELTLVLRLDGFNVSDPSESFHWFGEISNVPFVVEAPAGLRPGVYPGQVSILHDGMLLTRLVFDVEVGKAIGEAANLGARREQITSAFASYSSLDREEVLRRVQGIMAAGIDVFVDVLSLRAGDKWEEQLIKNIREKDIFYLFWSVEASKSQWVEREWRYALSERGIDFIHPIPLSDPREAPPPQELAGRHFNDLILSYLNSTTAQ
jgi:serine/threonine protein kinase